MVDMSYDDKYRLIDEDYLEDHINEIISLNEYIPSILTGIMAEIYIDPKLYSQWKYSIRKDVNKSLWSFYIRRKSVRQTLAEMGTGILGLLLELLIFIELHPQFEGIIKNWDYLDELVDQCEKEYNIDIMNYINDYEDLNKLLKKLKE